MSLVSAHLICFLAGPSIQRPLRTYRGRGQGSRGRSICKARPLFRYMTFTISLSLRSPLLCYSCRSLPLCLTLCTCVQFPAQLTGVSLTATSPIKRTGSSFAGPPVPQYHRFAKYNLSSNSIFGNFDPFPQSIPHALTHSPQRAFSEILTRSSREADPKYSWVGRPKIQ